MIPSTKYMKDHHVNSNKKFALNIKWVILATNNFTKVQYKDIAIFHLEC